MSNRMLMIQILAALFSAALLASGPAQAGKPAWAGQGKQAKGLDDAVTAMRSTHRSGAREREAVRHDFATTHGVAFCPPGLAKKRNGCLPPGQAKKRWRVGHRLPYDVVYHDLPERLVIELGRPPLGHKFVRVAADILLIAVGTGLVIDAIDDLGAL